MFGGARFNFGGNGAEGAVGGNGAGVFLDETKNAHNRGRKLKRTRFVPNRITSPSLSNTGPDTGWLLTRVPSDERLSRNSKLPPGRRMI
jgi:hypothetical protein